MAMEMNSRWRSALGASAGAGALLFTFACSGRPGDLTTVAAQPLAASQAGSPVLVGCEPHQRTLVRPVVVNGAAVSQVECVAVQQAAYAPGQVAGVAGPVPASYGPAGYPAAYPVAAPVAQPVYAPVADARVVPASYP